MMGLFHLGLVKDKLKNFCSVVNASNSSTAFPS